MMTTNSNIDRRAMATGTKAAWRMPTPYQGAAERGVVCQSASGFNQGGLLVQFHAIRPEGGLRTDRRRLQH
jgi:hypothetical protein